MAPVVARSAHCKLLWSLQPGRLQATSPETRQRCEPTSTVSVVHSFSGEWHRRWQCLRQTRLLLLEHGESIKWYTHLKQLKTGVWYEPTDSLESSGSVLLCSITIWSHAVYDKQDCYPLTMVKIENSISIWNNSTVSKVKSFSKEWHNVFHYKLDSGMTSKAPEGFFGWDHKFLLVLIAFWDVRTP